MPKMSDFDEYLNSTMVETGDIVVLLNEGEFIPAEDTTFNRTVFQISVRIPDNRIKTWTMNKTTQKRLIAAYGDESSQWVNKPVKLEILKQNVRGDMKNVLYGFPVEGEPTQIPDQAKIDSQDDKTNAIIEMILKAKPELSRNKLTELIAAEIENSGGTFGKNVATVLVARSLGIDLEKSGKKVG